MSAGVTGAGSIGARFERAGDAAAPPILGVPGIEFAHLFEASGLARIHAAFEAGLAADDPELHSVYAAFVANAHAAEQTSAAHSAALLAIAPAVSRFVAKLFGVQAAVAALRQATAERGPLWQFRREFVKKRVLKGEAGGSAAPPSVDADARADHAAVCAAVAAFGLTSDDEELGIARAGLRVLAVDATAAKAAKAGGAQWTSELRGDGDTIVECIHSAARTADVSDEQRGGAAAALLAAFERDLRRRRTDARDPASTWALLHAPRTLDYASLVQLRRPNPELPELFVGHHAEARVRPGFALTDERGSARSAEQEIDYCLYCHDRGKDSCSKGLRDPKTGELKKNPLGVSLTGCPLGEKISEMHLMRREGDVIAALAIVMLDNPMCPGTGHRICNDCMKGCVFQKQDPVNIPQVETRVLTEVLGLPYGTEIYGLLSRWNPLDRVRPHALPYNGKQVLVVGLGPAGYTLTHYLAREGFGVVAVDALKLEPLPAALTGLAPDGSRALPTAIHSLDALWQGLDERVVLGFGGVSEYGITVRWDKNFLALLYLTLSRNPLISMIGGVRFGGTLTVQDAFELGFDHVAIATGAGKPTIIDMQNNLARGIRKASDFLMGLQLSGAFKRSSLANLQVSLPAIVIGGGLTAIDTATELAAYYPLQIEKLAQRYDQLVADSSEAAVLAQFDAEEREILGVQLGHARELAAARTLAAAEGKPANTAKLVDKWGGVTLVYRKNLVDSPAYRLNHEEVEKSLEEGIRYVENLAPVAAELDSYGKVAALRFVRADKREVVLPAQTVCVAAGTSPNVTYEREHPGTFQLDAKGQYFLAHAVEQHSGEARLVPTRGGFFTSYAQDGRFVSFYGDNHPTYAGSVVRAMASAKDGFDRIAELFPRPTAAADRATHTVHHARIRDLLSAEVVEVNRLTSTIVEVVVRAPLAARKFLPGQFYRLQNFEQLAPVVDGTRLAMEGLALTGAWIDAEKGLLGTIVLEMGGSSDLCAALRPGEPIVLMGPTGAPTEIVANETVLLCGGGLGNAVLFSIARALKAQGARVLYFAGYKRGEDLFKQDEIERYTDQVIWTTDSGCEVTPRRTQDRHIRANIVEAMLAYARGELGPREVELRAVSRIIAIGSDRMMAAVKEARHGVLLPFLNPRHLAIGSINSPMQCMMKEVCAQCLQRHRHADGSESLVFSCFNQDQDLDSVDFGHLRARLRANSLQERLTQLWLLRLRRLDPAKFAPAQTHA